MDVHLTPGQRAHVDQVLALAEAMERAWPWNQHLLNDPEAERVLLERLRDEWTEIRDDRAYLLWAHGRLVEVEPDEHRIVRTVLSTAPSEEQECDHCRVVGDTAGVAVIAVPRNLVPLVLCTNCASDLNPEVLIPAGVSNG